MDRESGTSGSVRPPVRGRGRARPAQLAQANAEIDAVISVVTTSSSDSAESRRAGNRGSSRGRSSRGRSSSRGGTGRGVSIPSDETKSDGKSLGSASQSGGSSSNMQGVKSSTSSSDLEQTIGDEKRKLQEEKADYQPIKIHQRPGFGQAGTKHWIYTNQYRLKMTGSKPPDLNKFSFYCEGYEQYWAFKGGCNLEDNFKLFEVFHQKLLAMANGANRVAYFDGNHLVYSPFNFGLGMGDEEETLVYFYRDQLSLAPIAAEKDRNHERVFNIKFKLTNNLKNAFGQMGLLLAELQEKPKELVLNIDKEVIQALNVIIRHKAQMDFVRVGGNLYPIPNPNDRLPELGNGRQVVQGYNACFKLNQDHVALQFKDKCGGFYKSISIIEFLEECFGGGNRGGGGEKGRGGRGGRGGYGGAGGRANSVTEQHFWMDKGNRAKAEKLLKGLQVEIRYPGGNARVRKIMALSDGPLDNTTFVKTEKDGKEHKLSVMDYFHNHYGYRAQFQFMPCLNAKGKKARQTEYYPMELAHIVPNQPVKGKLTDSEVAAMIRVAAEPADATFNKIKTMMNTVKNKFEADLAPLGLEVNSNMEKVEGRVLNPPTLKYKSGTAQIRQGTWNPLSFIAPKNLGQWAIMHLSGRGGDQRTMADVQRFVQNMQREAHKNFGMQIPDPVDSTYQRFNGEDNIVEGYMNYLQKNGGVDMVLCVMERKDTTMYSAIKRVAERKFGILTQCVTMKSVLKANNQLFGMLLMKINAKLGGTACTVDWSLITSRSDGLFGKDPVMVVGMDVNTPMVNFGASAYSPSIAALASSTDAHAACYSMNAALTGEPSHATRLSEMMKKALTNFYKATEQRKPMAILFFRPGTNNEELKRVVSIEMGAIRKAIKTIQSDYSPKVTYITVTKHHNVRFCGRGPELAIGKSKNLPAGTVIDQTVTSPEFFDFYLGSSQGIQGTSISSHYRVLLDENNLSADSAQNLCWYLCHGYARCNRSISMPNCVKYAKLAAERARIWLKNAEASDSASEASYSSNAGARFSEDKERVKLFDDMLDTSKLLGKEDNPLHRRFYFT